MRWLGLTVAFAAGILALWFGLGGGAESGAPPGQGRVIVKAVQRVPNGAGSASEPRDFPPKEKGAAAAVAASRQSPLMAELARGRNFKALYERLHSKPDRTAEESFALAEVLATCGKSIPPVGSFRQRLGGEDRRRQFVDSLAPNDPLKDKRVAAFDEINHDPCAGLEGLDVKQADVRSLIAAAAAGGDPKARAALVVQEVRDSRQRDGKGPPGPMSITDGQLETLRAVLASNDPDAVVAAGRALTMPFGNFSLRTGPGESTADNQAVIYAAQFVACDLGARCGSDAPEVAFACAVNGRCTAAEFREHAYQNVLSAASAQQVQQYYEQLNRARAGDWSYFSFYRGQSPRDAIFSPRK